MRHQFTEGLLTLTADKLLASRGCKDNVPFEAPTFVSTTCPNRNINGLMVWLCCFLPQKMLVQLLLEEGAPVEIEVEESDNVLEKVFDTQHRSSVQWLSREEKTVFCSFRPLFALMTTTRDFVRNVRSPPN